MATTKAIKLPDAPKSETSFIIGVCSPADPRVDEASKTRAANIIQMTAEEIAKRVTLPDGSPVKVVYSETLILGEADADTVARQFKAAGVGAIVMCPDTWAFPQLTAISLLSHFPADIPVNITCGNSGPKPGVVYAHALNGALAQSGRMTALNVGTWPDTGLKPKMTAATAEALADWCFAALTAAGLKGRRVVIFGHDSMGMETALAHVIPTRNTFGLEITRLDMKLLADMLKKGAYSKKELKDLRGWVDKHIGKRVDLSQKNADKNLDAGLAMYLIMRDIMADHDAVGGGFMNQLEWGSEPKGLPLPICDLAESLFNTTFDHNGPKAALPFATEADTQGLLTMLVMTWLSGGNPPLFMDFRKVWEPREIQKLARKLKVRFTKNDLWAAKGFVDGNNSGSASLNWAGKPGAAAEALLKNVSMPGADMFYFPGGGNSVTFTTPGGVEGVAGRLTYSVTSGLFSMVWDEAQSVTMPAKLAHAVTHTSNWNWPHTFVVPKYATMAEYKQYAPANHFHMTYNLKPARLQHWMDLTNVLSATPWNARPAFIEGVDRPLPLLYVINGGEAQTKLLRK